MKLFVWVRFWQIFKWLTIERYCTLRNATRRRWILISLRYIKRVHISILSVFNLFQMGTLSSMIPLLHHRRQYDQMWYLKRRTIPGMMEAGLSNRRVASHLGHSDPTVSRCWDQCIKERGCIHIVQAQVALAIPITRKTIISYVPHI